jgi:actin-related protein
MMTEVTNLQRVVQEEQKSTEVAAQQAHQATQQAIQQAQVAEQEKQQATQQAQVAEAAQKAAEDVAKQAKARADEIESRRKIILDEIHEHYDKYTAKCNDEVKKIREKLENISFKDKDDVKLRLKGIEAFCEKPQLGDARAVRSMKTKLNELIDIVTTKRNEVTIPVNVANPIIDSLKSALKNLEDNKMTEVTASRKRHRMSGGFNWTDLKVKDMNVTPNGDGIVVLGKGVNVFIRPLQRGTHQFRTKMNGEVIELVWVGSPESMVFLREIRDKYGVHIVKRESITPEPEYVLNAMTPIPCRKYVGSDWISISMLMM